MATYCLLRQGHRVQQLQRPDSYNKLVKQTEECLFYFKKNGIALLDPMVAMETYEPRSDFSIDAGNSNILV